MTGRSGGVVLSSPSRLFAQVDRWLGKVVTLLAYVSALGVAFLVVGMVREVVGRYAFDAPSSWVDELAGYTVAGITFLGTAYALRQGELVAMTAVSERMPTRLRHTALAAGFLVGALVLAIVTYQVAQYVQESYRVGTLSNSALRVPLWIPRAVMLAGLVVLLLETVRQSVLTLAQVFSREDVAS